MNVIQRPTGHPAPPPTLDDDHLDKMFQRLDNTGRWGADDEFGTLNYITEDKRVAAARLVRAGHSVSLARPLRKAPTPHIPTYAEHILINNGAGHPGVADYLALRIHANHLTHLDAVGHIHQMGRFYNGRRVEQTVTAQGLTAGSIEPVARIGVFTRGVLLDLPAAFGVDWIGQDYRFGAEDLDAAAAFGGIDIEPGDAVFVRTGNETRSATEGPENPRYRPGPAPQAVEWLHNHKVALYGADAIEAHPDYPSRTYPLPLHMLAIPAMGLTLLDEPHLDTLAKVCAAEDRYEFLFTVAPLRLPGGTGSPVNPLAIF